jgi:putative Mg2+ transporter-C (MgtC) family protein
MEQSIADAARAYWSIPEVSVNVVVCLNLLGSLLLGLTVGYERTYHGRAAGMRTYGFVCMASTALTVLTGYPDYWFAGHAAGGTIGDPTRVIQGIVTGVGFIGAGVIMRDGINISGLTTAASIWLTSAIGILVGIGFYLASIVLTLLSTACMMWLARIEKSLPARPAIAITMTFRPGFVPEEDVLRRTARERGYEFAAGSLSIHYAEGRPVWHFVAVENRNGHGVTLSQLAKELASFEGVDAFDLSHARN